MTGVDMKSLLDKCNAFATTALTTAAGQAVTRTHYEVTIEHFFLACLADGRSDIPLALERFGIDIGKVTRLLDATLDDFRSGNAGRPVFSPLLIELLENAWLIASVDLGLAQIRSGTVLLAFLRKPAVYAQGSYADVFSAVSRDDLLRDFASLANASDETAAVAAAAPASGEAGQGVASRPGESFIAKFCEDFTAKARDGKIDPVFGRDEEIRQMVDILARRRKNNPILVGEPGVGKTAVLEGLALRIVEGDVPDVLAGVSLLSLDMGLLEAGAGMKGEFERRLKGVLDEIKTSEAPIILFIDEAHMLVGAGGAAGGSDAANLMKPALARGEIRTCAATTWKEYKKYFEKDPALARRFQLVKLDEPSVETATLILRGIRANYEKAHNVLIRDDAIAAAASLAHRYITGRFLPDKAIDLLDTACARVKVSLSAKPAPLEDKERAIQAAERELRGLQRDQANGVDVDAEHVAGLEKRIASLKAEVEKLEVEWREEREAAREFIDKRTAMLAAKGMADAAQTNKVSASEGDEVTPEDSSAATSPAEAEEAFAAARERLDALRERGALVHVEVTTDVVAQVVADWTGIPVGRMAQEQAAVTRDLDTLLARRIKGQDMALAAITKGIQASTAGLRTPDQPLGVFLLVGPSGVGKTETGLALAELLFGDESCVVTINMSEFQEKHTISRLIGSPPGYVGYGEGGMLTEAVRRRPYTVVLLDEAEKAHIDVLNLFYQVFDKGTLTDGEGKEVSFKNTIIMLTSNLASDIIQEMTGSDAEADMEAVLNVARPVLSEHFRPALLGRMTIVPYRSLESSAMKNITELKLQGLARRLRENKDMQLSWSEAVTEQIVARCSETETGARNIDYILSGSVLPRLAHSILDHMTDSAMPASVTLGVGEDGMFTMDFA
ncbi:MAG: type VI secretion system ATPase TssH [Desulfovibrio sp.]|nr:type VI secretion system ATPase TssH [Desulfovibrio sp.]